MYFLPQKAVDFEPSCIYCEVYVVLRRRNVRCYLRVMYKLLHCPEIPRWRLSVLPDKCIENCLKNNLYILIRYFDACFLLFWDINWSIIWDTYQGLYSVIVLVVYTEAQHLGLNTSIKSGWEFAISRCFVSYDLNNCIVL